MPVQGRPFGRPCVFSRRCGGTGPPHATIPDPMGRIFEKRKHRIFARNAKLSKLFTRVGKEI